MTFAQLATTAPGQAGADLHDIRGPVDIATPWTTALVVAAALAAVAAVVWLGVRRSRRRSPAPPAKTAEEVALARLAAARALMTPPQAPAFTLAVSEAVREYVEGRFGARAPRRTTEEFLHEVVARPGSDLAAHAPRLESFLHHCDLVKFARAGLSADEMEALHASARRFVEESRPPRPGATEERPT